jgi:manganese/zinc/iron transport system substrate-binding protein
MTLNRRAFFGTSSLAGIPLLGTACADLEKSNHVLATTTLVADLVTEILPSTVPVRLLMGPGIDPHTYEPTAGTIAHIRQAKLIVGHGLHLEGRLTNLLETSKSGAIHRVSLITRPIEISKPERLRKSDHAWDPHIWFDASLWAETVIPLSKVLEEVFPELRAEIAKKANKCFQTLGQLHAEMQAGYSSIPENKRILITSHDAFGYLGQAYGLEVHAIQGISTAAEVSESALRDLAELACQKQVNVGFLESTVSPRTLEKLRSLIRARSPRKMPLEFRMGGEIYSDSLGGPNSGAATYASMMRHNLRVIVGALKNE